MKASYEIRFYTTRGSLWERVPVQDPADALQQLGPSWYRINPFSCSKVECWMIEPQEVRQWCLTID